MNAAEGKEFVVGKAVAGGTHASTQNVVSGISPVAKEASTAKFGDGSPDGRTVVEQQEREHPKGFALFIILVAIFLNTLLAALDLGIVATAIPQITDEFQQLDQVGWYGSAYFVTIGVFSPFWGKLYKYCSTKIIFICTVALFMIGSVVCATAPMSSALIVGRSIQGWGAAGILNGAFLLMHHIAPPHRQPTFTGVLLACFICSSVLGPIIGGAFTSNVTWRWCFYVNLPVGGLAIPLIIVFFRTPKHVKPVPITLRELLIELDFLGTLTLIASLVCFILALEWGGQTKPWSDGSVIATLVMWLVLTIAFCVIEHSVGEHALIPARLLKRRVTWASSLFGLIINDADWTLLYYLPIYFQSIQGLSPIGSGIANLPNLVFFALGSLVSGHVAAKTRLTMSIATIAGLLCVIGAALVFTMDVDTSRPRYLGYQVLLGLGLGIGNQIPMTAVQGFSAPEDLTSNTSIVLMAQLISGCYFVTAAQSIFANVLLRAMSIYAPAIDPKIVLNVGTTAIRDIFSGEDLQNVLRAYMAGLRGIFALGLAGAALSVLVSLLIPNKRLPLPAQAEQKSGEPEEKAA